MAVRKKCPWSARVAVTLLWIWTLECGCDTQTEEVELFHSQKQAIQGWKSDPSTEWNTVKLNLGTGSSVPVLQACKSRRRRRFLSPWMERQGARHVLMDIVFALEEELSGQSSPLQVDLVESDTPLTRFQSSVADVELRTTSPFPADLSHLSRYLQRRALDLGSVSHRGFHIAFSYAGTCAVITSVRLYYRRCSETVANLALFVGTGAGSGPQAGSCVKGAVEVSPPVRECGLDGTWGPLQGACTCETGHEVVNDSCRACRMSFYKPANDSEGCRPCPANSRTHREGSERCDCLQGFSRLPTDPRELGCTKPPSAPVNLTAHHYNDSELKVTWDPPHDWGGRKEIMYDVECERKAEAGHHWESCGEDVMFLPNSSGLTNTSVTVLGLKPQWDYRLSLQAWNDVSSLLRMLPPSTATVTIQRWKIAPEVVTVTPDVNVSEHDTASMKPVSHQQSRFSAWLIVGVLFGILLLVAVIPIALCTLGRNYKELRSDQTTELLPRYPVVFYRRPEVVEVVPQQENTVEGAAQLFEEISPQLLDSLKDVLVERNQLTLGKELGKGEFGSVYEGVFTPVGGMDVKVAVKTMRVGMNCRKDLQEFLREAEMMKNFDHENVVRLLGVTLHREPDSPLPIPLVLLPYMKHGDLRRFLIATRYGDIPMFVPHQSLLRFMIDIAAGMDYLGSKGFLHRDLAARNCMLGDDLRVSVADFGLSKKIYSNCYQQKVTIRVPIKWMAIESLSESLYTTKSDVWAFGVTMWEIVSRGRTPYPGVHNHELLDLLLSGHRLKQPEDCDHRLYRVMHSCWDQEPNRRPSFSEVGETLKGLLSELPALEASQEANYINQGLEIAAAAAASLGTQTDDEGRHRNVYLQNPVGAAAAAALREDYEIEDGYLKYTTDLA
ncbi:tyrosine-protein kinase Mer [Betta splendens]|uniref:receptor protein-tyrosine kinase n=1 Tax=Betta splendens TaxID=158456 RepID=A0A6P7LPE7_BETSP|nr:tyrosine-protein kinase Mer [Betta splendens]